MTASTDQSKTGLMIAAPAGTLTGTTLASNVVNASLNSITPAGGTLGIKGDGDPFGRFYGFSTGISSSTSAFLQINAGAASNSGIDFGAAGVRTAGITSNATETTITTLGATPLILGFNGSEKARVTSTGLSVTGSISAGGALALTDAANNSSIRQDRAFLWTSTGVNDGTIRAGVYGTNTDNLVLAVGPSLTTVLSLASGNAAVTGSISATSYVEGAEQTAPAAPAANGYRIFAQDNGAGKTQLMVIFASGAAQQIAIEP